MYFGQIFRFFILVGPLGLARRVMGLGVTSRMNLLQP